MARKPLDGTLAANTLRHGCGGINVDGCRVGTEGGTAKGSKPEGDGRGIYGAGLHGACEINDIGKGRWPANLVHDGSDEVVGLFPESKSPSTYTRSADSESTCVSGLKGIGEKAGSVSVNFGDSGSAARFFYCAKASDREILPAEEHPLFGESYAAVNNTHPTVKPVDLMRWLIRLVTPPGGVLLEPFMGSGTTLVAAKLEGRRAVGIEINPEYCEIAVQRLKQEATT
jgi:site-specific DNA-methyltransferase (adenine-specific)